VGVIVEGLVNEVVLQNGVGALAGRVIDAAVVTLLLGDAGAVGRLLLLHFHS
jgi:hypothetical protein